MGSSPWCACGHREGQHEGGKGSCVGRRWADDRERTEGGEPSLNCECNRFRDHGEAFGRGLPVRIPIQDALQISFADKPVKVGDTALINSGDEVHVKFESHRVDYRVAGGVTKVRCQNCSGVKWAGRPAVESCPACGGTGLVDEPKGDIFTFNAGNAEVTLTWVHLVRKPDPLKVRKTHVVDVYANQGDKHLGVIRWYGAWRCYAFYPELHTLFEPKCLMELAGFMGGLMEERKKAIKENLAEARRILDALGEK